MKIKVHSCEKYGLNTHSKFDVHTFKSSLLNKHFGFHLLFSSYSLNNVERGGTNISTNVGTPTPLISIHKEFTYTDKQPLNNTWIYNDPSSVQLKL